MTKTKKYIKEHEKALRKIYIDEEYGETEEMWEEMKKNLTMKNIVHDLSTYIFDYRFRGFNWNTMKKSFGEEVFMKAIRGFVEGNHAT